MICVIVNSGEEVIIFELCFVVYDVFVFLVGGILVYVYIMVDKGFKVMVVDFEVVVIEKIKVIFICLFLNLIGLVYLREELSEIVEFVKKYDVIVLVDEIYVELIYDEEFISIVVLLGMKEWMVVILGFLKVFVMMGWRFGFVVVLFVFWDVMFKIY